MAKVQPHATSLQSLDWHVEAQHIIYRQKVNEKESPCQRKYARVINIETIGRTQWRCFTESEQNLGWET